MNPSQLELLADLPGAERIAEGLDDYHKGVGSISACLVRIARPRLIRAGLMSASAPHPGDAELELYQLLTSEGNRAHSRYNALLRELISFEHALDHRLSRLRSI